MKDKSAAILTLRGAAHATPKGRKALAAWLRKEAKHLERCGHNYAPRFSARYFVAP
jgi:hypothetical protein